MSLADYSKKRNLKKSGEPDAVRKRSADLPVFVVHRHLAGHLHYDLRLEIDGVLKSWALPKGPSMSSSDKRLAVRVEDHPYDYKDFKGLIPEGYGAGIVEIWDKGTYTAADGDIENTVIKIRSGFRVGHLKIVFKGKKLKGEFLLQKTGGTAGSNWLLIKHADRHALPGQYDAEKLCSPSSAINKWLLKNNIPRSKAYYHKPGKNG
jgi:bifunctional non-homologous end joining protein LigD